MEWLEGVVSMDGRLEGRERADRRLLFLFAVVLSPISIILFIMTTAAIKPLPPLLYPFIILSIASNIAVSLLAVCKVSLTKLHQRLYVVSCAASTIALDHHMHTISTSSMWPLMVLLADLALTLRLGRNFSAWLIGITAMWVVVSHFESTLRLGLFDLPGTESQEFRQEFLREQCVCDSAPCPVHFSLAMQEMCLSLFVLLVDFFATRGFADEAEKEQAAMARTIDTVEAIAKLLAGYDVDTVAEMLQEAEAEGRLPAAMHEALQRLEQNLRAYRPYLPEALFETQDEDCRFASLRAAPGAINEEVAIVFTDVRASTSIWEAAPEAMKKAMQTHNMVMRDAIRLLGGYEVKTIGDAFMVAFEEARVAVDFALLVQDRLLDAEWPAALLEVPICNRSELWGGLTVRVGVNHGPVTLETNALTGRVDYFGHTVNVAARLEGVCIPGAVAVPADLWAQVGGSCLPAVAGPAVPADLKGVSEALPMRHVWPAGLAGRAHCTVEDGSESGSTSTTVSLGETNSRRRHSHSRHVPLCDRDATIGSLTACSVVDIASSNHISQALEAVMPLLQQSRGTLITLLGEHVFVGWNLVQAVPVHAENAISFAQRLGRSQWGTDTTLGLASGTVHHGDVGTASQRFVTAAGSAVSASLRIWNIARDRAVPCLYTTVGHNCREALQAELHADNVVLPPGCTAVYRPGMSLSVDRRPSDFGFPPP